MKRLLTFYTVATTLAAAMTLPLLAAPVHEVVSTPEVAPHSTFEMPADPDEGRDPFFPSSLRPYGTSTPTTTSHKETVVLVVKGISYSRNKFFAIINNHTFAAGDEQEVNTPDGLVRVHCLSIDADSVVVEVDGKRYRLYFVEKP